MVGSCVGAGDGSAVGSSVGTAVGTKVGALVGDGVANSKLVHRTTVPDLSQRCWFVQHVSEVPHEPEGSTRLVAQSPSHSGRPTQWTWWADNPNAARMFTAIVWLPVAAKLLGADLPVIE